MKKKILALVLTALMAVTMMPQTPVEAKQKKVTIEDVDVYEAIEADVRINGSGSGYHGKLVLAAPLSAVSFGIQHDEFAAAPYTGKTMLIVENILSNEPGGQSYYRPKRIEVKPGKTYHMMLTLTKSGKVDVYFNYKKIASYKNRGLANVKAWPRVEASARLNGDKVRAEFKNIEVKNDQYDETDDFSTVKLDVAPQIHSKIIDNSHCVISGTLSGLVPGHDWDSAYEQVSGIVQYQD